MPCACLCHHFLSTTHIFWTGLKFAKALLHTYHTTHLRLLVCITNNQSALLFTLFWLAVGHQRSIKVQQRQFFFYQISIQKQMLALNKCSTTNWLVKNLLCHFAIPEMILVDQSNKNLLLSHVRCQRIRTSR